MFRPLRAQVSRSPIGAFLRAVVRGSPGPVPQESVVGLPGGAQAGIARVISSSVFYSHFRLHCILAIGRRPATEPPVARLVQGPGAPPQSVSCRWLDAEAGYELVIEALVDRSRFPAETHVEIVAGPTLTLTLPVPDLLAQGFLRESSSLQPAFKTRVETRAARAAGRPTLLDLGGRARSGVEYGSEYPECVITTFDIVAAPGVDVVGDAHALSRHFPPESFDFVLCVSVFEHLLMPWKVALEMNKVMKPGGTAFIHTHQTIGIHDAPWDFLRFSPYCWPAFFNAATGFEILDTAVGHFQHIVPRGWTERYSTAERSGGFESSAVLVRKTGDTALDWAVDAARLTDSVYPRG
jgi:hypothetical protein